VRGVDTGHYLYPYLIPVFRRMKQSWGDGGWGEIQKEGRKRKERRMVRE
jgi:hypothetical protein